ncbi:MAG: glycosyltransferase family 39 protein [Candidatus Daviesbacteria bacterium]|nr:glycosyltransferase family 39 protein [Candidatus Daviesbacteria bacterium]
MKILKFIFNQYTCLFLILVIGFLVRLYKIDTPLADWHSWRQADTAAVARNFYKEGYTPFIPKYDDMSGVAENPIPNPNRYRFVEFPIYNSLVYFAYVINGGVDIRLARLVSIIMSLGSIIFLFLTVRRQLDRATALTAAFVFAVLPYSIFYSRVILPEPTLIFFSLGMLYFVDRWIYEDSLRLYFVSVFFTICAFLVKPVAGFYLLPLLYSYYKKEGKLWPPKRYFLWIIPALAPFIAWRIWMSNFPEGIPASNWLFNGTHIRFRPAFWRWIFGDRFGREILGMAGSFLFFFGLIKKPETGKYLLHFLVLSSFLYLLVFATGNVTHDYYQTIIIPALSVFVAVGLVTLFRGFNGMIPRIFTIPLAIFMFTLMIYLGWNEVKGLYQINNGVIVEAGEFADKILPKNAVVVAPYGGDTAFLYQVNRPGFAYSVLPVKDLVNKFGVKYYVSVDYNDKTNWVIRNFKTLEKNPKFVIADLSQPISTTGAVLEVEPN